MSSFEDLAGLKAEGGLRDPNIPDIPAWRQKLAAAVLVAREKEWRTDAEEFFQTETFMKICRTAVEHILLDLRPGSYAEAKIRALAEIGKSRQRA